MDRLKIEVCVLESFIPVRFRERSEQIVDSGTTVEDLAPKETSDGNWAAILNGKTIRPNEWKNAHLGDRSQVIYTEIPAASLAPLWTFLTTTYIGAALVSVAIQWGIAQLVGTPEIESFDGPGDRTYSFSNLQQTATTGVPINIVYGTHPVAGNLIELDVRGYNPTETESIYTSSMDMTVGLCEGEIDAITALSINGNDIASYGTVASYTSNVGTNAQAALGSAGTSSTYTVGVTLVQGAMISTEVYKLESPGGPGAFTESVNSSSPWSGDFLPSYLNLGDEGHLSSAIVTGLSSSLTGTARLYAWSSSGGTFTRRWVKVYNVSSSSNMDEVLSLPAGHALSFSDPDTTTSPHYPPGGTGVASKPGYDGIFYVIEADGIPEIIDILPPGGGYGEETSYTTSSAVDSLRLNFTFPQGLYAQTNTGIDPRTMTIVFQYRNTAEAVDAFGVLIERTITSEQVGNFTWTIDIDFSDTTNFPIPGGITPSSPQSYQIKVQTVGVQQGDGAHSITLDSVVEIVDQVYAYPNIATVRAIINADESLNGSTVPNLVATVRGRKIQRWNGVSLADPVFEDDSPDYNNPAWIVWDLLTSTRYGLGNWVSQSNLDLQSFDDWAEWCNELVSDGAGGTEKRATWNGVIDKEGSSWDACLMVCSSARATLYTVGELIRVKFERDRSPTQLFSMANILEGSFSQSYVSRLDRPTRIDVRFLRADSNYQVDTVGVDDPDAITANLPQRITTVQLAGITRESQAMREARFRLNLEKLSTIVTWKSSIDSIAVEPGDLCLLSHDVPKWGTSGRVDSATSTTITLDDDVTFGDMSEGNTYQIIVRHNSDDSREIRDIAASHANTTVAAGSAITVQSAWSATPASLDVYSIGHSTNYTREVVVTGIKTQGDLTRTIEGVLYNSAIHEDDIAQTAFAVPFLPDASQPPGVVTDLAAVEIEGGERISTTSASFAIAWQYPEGVPLGGAKIYKRRTSRSGDYTHIGSVDWPRTQTEISLGLAPLASHQPTYDIAIVAVSAAGAHLPPTSGTNISITPTGATTIGKAVSGVTLSADEEELRISWDGISDSSVYSYEVRKGLEWVGSILLGTTTDTELRTTNWTPTGSSGISENYMVRAVGPNRIYANIGIATDTNTLTSNWFGGTARTNDFKASGAWTGCSFNNVTINADGNLQSSASGGPFKVQTGTYDVGSSDNYHVGVIAHARIEGDSFSSASYAWKSREGMSRTWGGYTDQSNLSSDFEFKYRTRASSSHAWSDWKPISTRTATVAFREIQLIILVTPNNYVDDVHIEQLYLRLET